MSLHFWPKSNGDRKSLTIDGERDWRLFPDRAQATVDQFGVIVTEKIDGLHERLRGFRSGERSSASHGTFGRPRFR